VSERGSARDGWTGAYCEHVGRLGKVFRQIRPVVGWPKFLLIDLVACDSEALVLKKCRFLDVVRSAIDEPNCSP
jgi:hypothetical protein